MSTQLLTAWLAIGSLSDVGYRIYDSSESPIGARVTAGVTDRGDGWYAASVDVPTNAASVRWDSAGTATAKAREYFDPLAGQVAAQVWSTVLPGSFAAGTAGYTINNRLASIKLKTDALSDTPAADVWEILTEEHSSPGTFGEAAAAAGGTLDLSAVRAALASSQAALVRIQAAVYDTARVSGNVIFMSDGHTQRLTAGGRQTV